MKFDYLYYSHHAHYQDDVRDWQLAKCHCSRLTFTPLSRGATRNDACHFAA